MALFVSGAGTSSVSGKEGKMPHAYLILSQARSAIPPLELALDRATLLRHLCVHGPATVLQLLQCHWEVEPRTSWLGAL